MDLRIKRTKNSIINAFIELRAKKPLERITVKELAELACINKATFYTHYKDIYDLSEQLENDAVQNVLNDVPHPEYLIIHPKMGTIELAEAIRRQGKLFHILFSGSRLTVLTERLETNIKNHIYKNYPEYQSDLEKEMILSVIIHGCFYTFIKNADKDFNTVIEILGGISECLIQEYRTWGDKKSAN